VRQHGFGHFDAELDRHLAQREATTPAARSEPCRLTLEVKIQFNFLDAPTPWPPGRAARWQEDFIRVVTNRWSFRYLLAPTQPCPAEPCRLATAIVRVVPVTSDPHHVVNVFYDKPTGARSYVASSGPGQMYGRDVESRGRDLRRSQTTASHEFGHMLGLGHVHCDTNNDDCYGVTREESADVMGRGEIVTVRDYEPFAQIMSRITGCEWRPLQQGGPTRLFGPSNVPALTIFGGVGGAIAGALIGGVAGGILGGLIGAGIGALAGLIVDEVS